jgi:hypothetical protein
LFRFSQQGLKVPNEVLTFHTNNTEKLNQKGIFLAKMNKRYVSCSVSIGGDMVYTDNCGGVDAQLQIHDYFVQRFYNMYIGNPYIESIRWQEGYGIVIQGDADYLAAQTNYSNIMIEFAQNLHVSCIGSNSFYFASLRVSNSCTASGGGSPGDNQDLNLDSLTKKYPCVTNTVIGGLLGISDFGDLMQPFITTNWKPDLKFYAEPLSWGTSGIYELAHTDTKGSITGASSNITLNSHAIENSSELLIASTIIHETEHAYLNYYFASNGMPDLMAKSSTSYMAGLYQYTAILNPTDNLGGHSTMMMVEFDKMVNILNTYGQGRFSIDDCRKAMLYGLNNPGSSATAQEAADLNQIYQNLLLHIGNTEAGLNTFHISNLNTSIVNRVPINCP